MRVKLISFFLYFQIEGDFQYFEIKISTPRTDIEKIINPDPVNTTIHS